MFDQSCYFYNSFEFGEAIGNIMPMKQFPSVNNLNFVCKNYLHLSQVAEGQMVSKAVPFTCLPQGRTAELYVEKAKQGQALPELRNLETTFETNVEQPKRCVSSIKKV